MRIPYLGLLALGGAQNDENQILELEKQVIEQLEQELDQSSKHKYNKDCPDGNFRCRDGTCIDGKARCDGISDCSDESDETDCKAEQRLQHSSNQKQQRMKRQSDYDFNFGFTTAMSFLDGFGDFTTEGSFGDFDDFFPETTEGFAFGPATTPISFIDMEMTTGAIDFLQQTTDANFFDMGLATTAPPFLDNLATTAPPFLDGLGTTEGFDFGMMATTASMDIPIMPTTAPLDFAETTEAIDFGAFGTTAPTFLGTTQPLGDFDFATTAPMDFGLLETTPGFDFGGVQTTQSGMNFLQSTEAFAAGLETTAPLEVVETTEALDFLQTTAPSFEMLETTESPSMPQTTVVDFVPETTVGVELPLQTTAPDLDLGLETTPTMPLVFPEGTTEDMLMFPTTAMPTFPSVFTEFPLLPTTMPLPEITTQPLPPAPTTQPFLPVQTEPAPVIPTVDPTQYFSCRSGESIAQQYVCDRYNDCRDGSDEENCAYTVTTNPPTTMKPTTTTVPIPQDTTGPFETMMPPTDMPSNLDDREHVVKFIDQFIRWRTTIFDKWLSVMKIYQQRSNIVTQTQYPLACMQFGRKVCKNMSKTCKQDLTGCQYCYCEISRTETDTKFIKDEYEMDVSFWIDVLQPQWKSVWEQWETEWEEYDYP